MIVGAATQIAMGIHFRERTGRVPCPLFRHACPHCPDLSFRLLY
jgi:hypothetical protein